MKKIWKLRKVFAFILTLTAFVNVGYMISQNGRYQAFTVQSGVVMTIDTQTGCVEYFEIGKGIFYKIDYKNQTFKSHQKNNLIMN